MPPPPFLILALEGGGFRTLFAARILDRIEARWGREWRSRIGLIAGTSGGAILGAGLAAGVSAAALVRFYERHGPAIFPRRAWPRLGFLRSRCDSRALRASVADALPDRRLDEVGIPLLIPAADIETGTPVRFRSWASGPTDPVALRDAVLASCAAPTWFDPHPVRGRLLGDGGLWALNPALTALVEAPSLASAAGGEVRVLSIGGGLSADYFGRPPTGRLRRLWWSVASWGLAGRWRLARLVELQIGLQSIAARETMEALLGGDGRDTGRFLHLAFTSPELLRFDDATTGPALREYADAEFARRGSEIARLLGKHGSPGARLRRLGESPCSRTGPM